MGPGVRPSELQPKIVVPGWPIVKPPLLLAQVGPLLAVAFSGPLDKAVEDLFLEELLHHFASRHGQEVWVIYHIGASFRVDAASLKRLSNAVKPHHALLKQTTKAFGYVTKSPFARAALKTMIFLAGLPYPASVYDSPDAAFKVFARSSREVDAAALAEAYALTLKEYLPSLHAEWR